MENMQPLRSQRTKLDVDNPKKAVDQVFDLYSDGSLMAIFAGVQNNFPSVKKKQRVEHD